MDRSAIQLDRGSNYCMCSFVRNLLNCWIFWKVINSKEKLPSQLVPWELWQFMGFQMALFGSLALAAAKHGH